MEGSGDPTDDVIPDEQPHSPRAIDGISEVEWIAIKNAFKNNQEIKCPSSVSVSVSVHAYVHTCLCMRMCTRVCACVCAHVSVHAYVHTCLCMHVCGVCVSVCAWGSDKTWTGLWTQWTQDLTNYYELTCVYHTLSCFINTVIALL